jgi:hypothetical protein
MKLRRLLVLCALAACGQEKIAVRNSVSSDYNHAALVAAVDSFVASGRTAEAFAALSRRVLELRPGMDHAVAGDAELKLLVLALAPIEGVRSQPIAAQLAALALTVWPTLLAPAVEANELLAVRDPHAAAIMPRPGEDPGGYLVRLCGGPLAGDCKQIVPELQAGVVAAIATRRATERVRNAVGECVLCGAEAGWREAVRVWEALDRAATASLHETQRRAAPDNWPVAGAAAEPDPGLPEAEISETGKVVIAGQRYGAGQRVSALRDLRGDRRNLALHVRPETPLAQVRALLGDARRAGAVRVAVVAREPSYPWTRRAYWIAEGVGTRPGLRPTDSLQLLLHAVDAIAGPGAIARVD